MRATVISMARHELLLRLDDGTYVAASGYDGVVDYDHMTPEAFRRRALEQMGERERDRVAMLRDDAVLREKARDHATMTPEEFEAKWYPTPLSKLALQIARDFARDIDRRLFFGDGKR